MIFITTRLKNLPIPVSALQKKAQVMLKSLDYSNFSLSIKLTSNRTIQRFNREYRGKDKPTDIISFPFYPELRAGERINAQTADEKYLGDIIISPEYVARAAKKHGQTTEERLVMLLAHGIAHLLGYDHETDADYEKMQQIEKKLLKSVNSPLCP